MTIYLDIVILENIVMNYIILYVTGVINKSKIHRGKMLLSSMIGSAYAVTSYLSIIQGGLNILLKVLLSVAMIYIAFKPNNYKSMCKALLLFYLTSFTLGGCAFFLLYYMKPQEVFMRNGVLVGSYPMKITLLGGIIGAVIITVAFNIRKGKISKKDMFYEIEIFLGEKHKKVKAMLDTGNLLREPITATPVIVVEKEQIQSLLPEKVIKNLSDILQGRENSYMEAEYVSRFRVIPFSSLGKQNGLLLGFRPDKVLIQLEEQTLEKINVMIGIYEETLSKNGMYTALIGLDLMEGGKEHEFIASIKV